MTIGHSRQTEVSSATTMRVSIFPTVKHRVDFLPYVIYLLKELVAKGLDLKLDLTSASEFDEVDENEMAD